MSAVPAIPSLPTQHDPAGGWTDTFSYDAAGRLARVTSPAGDFTYDYEAGPGVPTGGRVRRLGLPGGAYLTNDYDHVGRLLFTKLFTSTGVVTNAHSYTYNVASQRTGAVRSDASTVAYGYDALGQLTSARATNAAGQPLTSEHRGYAYDPAWNLAWRTNALWPQWFHMDGKNQLTNALTTGAQTHDASGNLLTRATGLWSYGWDDENRLVALTNQSQGTRTALVYDGLSRLRVRQEWVWVAYTNNPPDSASAALPGGGLAAARAGGGATLQLPGGGGGGSYWQLASETRYVYDGRRVVQERDGGNGPAVSYTRGDDLSGTLEGAGGIGGLLGRSSGYNPANGRWAVHACYHADGNGNVTFLLLTNQVLAARYVYDPYG